MRSPHPWYLIADIIWYLTCVYFPLSVKWNSSSSIAVFGQRTNKYKADFGTELFMGHFPHKYCTCSFAISTGPSLLLANCIWLWNKSIIHAFRNVASRWCWSTVLHYFLLSRKYVYSTNIVQFCNLNLLVLVSFKPHSIIQHKNYPCSQKCDCSLTLESSNYGRNYSSDVGSPSLV